MAGLMNGDGTLFALRHHLGFLFEAADDSVNGIEEILLAHGLTVATGSNQSGFITYVGDVGARESWCLTRQKVHIEVVCKLERTQMDIEDGDALRQFGKVNVDLTIETSGTQEGRVEDFNAVGRRQNDDARVGAEAVHLCEQLVEGVFALVVSAECGVLASGASDGINFVDEDDAGRFFLGLAE